MNINSATAEAAPAPVSAPAHIAKRLKALPACAIKKYDRLRRAATKARAAIDGLQVEIDRVRENRSAAQRDLALHDRRYPPQETIKDGKRVIADDPARTELAAAVDDFTRELARLQAEAHSVVIPNIGTIESWLAAQDPGAKFVPAMVAVPKLGKHETLAAALERVNEDMRRVADELATVQNAPRTVTEAKAAMRARIEALAARGRPDVAGLFTDDDVRWPTEQFIAGGHGAHEYAVTATVKDHLALLVWAHREALIAALDREIEAHSADDVDALSADDQAARIAQLTAQLTVLKRQAEQLRDRLEADGVPVPQRDFTDVEVLLGIERAAS
jgi:hypothetical protein